MIITSITQNSTTKTNRQDRFRNWRTGCWMIPDWRFGSSWLKSWMAFFTFCFTVKSLAVHSKVHRSSLPNEGRCMPNRELKKSFSRGQICEFPKKFEGQLSKTWLFQLPANHALQRTRRERRGCN